MTTCYSPVAAQLNPDWFFVPAPPYWNKLPTDPRTAETVCILLDFCVHKPGSLPGSALLLHERGLLHLGISQHLVQMTTGETGEEERFSAVNYRKYKTEFIVFCSF